MQDYRCSVAECSGTVWRACERCDQAFCERHARWYLVEYVRESWSTFTFVCYDCVPRNVDEDKNEDEDRSDQDAEADTGTRTTR